MVTSMHKYQSGAVLIIGLIMMLLLTIIGLASIRGSGLQEQMAGNTRDRNLAFQAAEAGLRIGEDLLDKTTIPNFSGGTIGYWPDLNDSSSYSLLTAGSWPVISGTNRRLRPSLWIEDQWKTNSVQLPANTLNELSEQPRYTIEQIVVAANAANQGSGADVESLEKLAETEYFRVSSRGLGGTVNAEVILQSTYAR